MGRFFIRHQPIEQHCVTLSAISINTDKHGGKVGNPGRGVCEHLANLEWLLVP
jgi:hypothetical protein